MKKIVSTKPARNGILILLVALLAAGVVFLSRDITPATHRVEKPLDNKQFSKN